MSTEFSREGIARMQRFSLGCSVLLLLLHWYYRCYYNFKDWGLTNDIFKRLLIRIQDTGVFSDHLILELIVLALATIGLLGVGGRKDESIGVRGCLFIIGGGLLVYFMMDAISASWIDTDNQIAIIYMVGSGLGYLVFLWGASMLGRSLPNIFRNDDPFGKMHGGFPQEEYKRVSAISLHFPAQYLWKGKSRASWVNIVNPRRGILVVGSPGCGKSRFIIEPAIRQLIEQGSAMFVYDFKFDTLSRQVYHHFCRNRNKYPAEAGFFCVNFTDLSRSHRCNVIDPDSMEWMADALGVSRTILLSMNKTWVSRQGEFFVESPINFLAALIWFLRKYEGGVYCTLPHVIELSQVSYDKLFSLLRTEPEVSGLITPFVDAYIHQSKEMLDGQVSSARIPLGRLISPDLYYILTGNDLRLDINDPAAPKVLCLGGDPGRQEALAPVVSLYIDRLNKLINRPGRRPCALVCDEFATIRAYSMATIVATARSNGIVPLLAVQDISQLRTQYSRDEAQLFLHISGNLFCGQVSGETAKWVSEVIPRVWQDRTSVSINSQDTSINHSRQWESAITPATVANLSSGEFIGIVADDPGKEMELKAFHSRLSVEYAGDGIYVPLPVVREVGQGEVRANFDRVKREVRELVVAELGRMMGDPALSALMLE